MSRCVRCRAVVDHVTTGAGYEIALDLETLDTLDELHEIVTGGRTFTRHTSGEVHSRDAATIRTRPAGTRARQAVHRAHRCTPTPAGDGRLPTPGPTPTPHPPGAS